jgi:hypothetical protein
MKPQLVHKGVPVLAITIIAGLLLYASPIPASAGPQGCATYAHQHYIPEAYTDVTDFRLGDDGTPTLWGQHRI